ncbi:LPXTG-motif cell wall anchor domain-containing protein [Glycomyces sambucus]|uniref:LPXTG-motif cell wall anchor domain-containing protein n=1 Tax=Glycomyces sambucus TaxID=380244 RepID=A0A1G9H1S9_9ACTN|nr:LPXTG cell wall anchor domain-containing protein [Glycomyces sambucus]SDL06847.1 LPXTG-motif cell wall anchor domain-containing protein [Glycomyces sambucus]
MPAPSSLAARALKRSAALAGAAALGAGAFALPAHAQTPAPAVEVVFDEPVQAGADFATGAIGLEFGDDFTPGEHDVFAQLSVYGDGWELAPGETGDGACTLDAIPPQWVNCDAADSDAEIDFAFDYRIDGGAPSGDYDWTLLVSVDGTALEPVNGTVEVAGDEGGGESPFLYESTELEIESGSTVGAGPVYYQEGEIPADTAALVYGVSAPEYMLAGTAEVTAPYDNCVDGFNGGPGVTCVVTDFPDEPGSAVTTTQPVEFTVFREVPGPIELCGCSFEVRAVDAAELEAEFGGVPTTGDLFGLAVADGSHDPADFASWGPVTIRTTPDHPFDLAIEDADIKGDNGDQVTVTIPVENLGPADAWSFFDGPGSYALVGELPEGTEFVSIAADESAYCKEFSDDYLGETVPAIEDRDAADFVCIFTSVPRTATYDVELTVKVTDEDADAKGVLQIVAFQSDGHPGAIETETDDNRADLTLNGTTGSGQLPKTGSSMTWILAGAGAALVIGAVLFIATRRRKTAAEPAE